MAVLLIILVIGLIPAMIATSKGRNFFLWYLYGCALFIIALVHALLLKSPQQKAIEAKLARGGVSEAEELQRFAKLRDDGVITEAEFQSKKRALLAGGAG